MRCLGNLLALLGHLPILFGLPGDALLRQLDVTIVGRATTDHARYDQRCLPLLSRIRVLNMCFSPMGQQPCQELLQGSTQTSLTDQGQHNEQERDRQGSHNDGRDAQCNLLSENGRLGVEGRPKRLPALVRVSHWGRATWRISTPFSDPRELAGRHN